MLENDLKRCTSEGSKNLIEHHVVWSDPGDEGKITECCKDIRRNPVPDKHPHKHNQEVFVSGKSPAGNNYTVLISEQSMEKSCINESGWPDHCSRPDKKSTHDAGQRVSDTLSRDDKETAKEATEILAVKDVLR